MVESGSTTAAWAGIAVAIFAAALALGATLWDHRKQRRAARYAELERVYSQVGEAILRETFAVSTVGAEDTITTEVAASQLAELSVAIGKVRMHGAAPDVISALTRLSEKLARHEGSSLAEVPTDAALRFYDAAGRHLESVWSRPG
jgi:hypothetical protein